MKRILHPWLGPLALVVAYAFLGAPDSAMGYWGVAGNATGSVTIGTLTAPAITAASAGGETVELSWSAVSAPGEGTVEYYVSRDGGSPSAACPSSSVHSPVTSCTDTNVPIGAHKYVVTAVWRSWSAASEEHNATVSFGPATHLVLEAASATPAAGEADNLTIAAKDAQGNTVRNYTGTHTVSFEGAGESASGSKPAVLDKAGTSKSFGEATELTFAEGKATVASGKNGVMKLYRAEEAHIIVKEGSLTNGAGLAVAVKAAATKKLALAAPSEATAGRPLEVTLTAIDEYANTTTSYTGAKTLAWSGPANSPSNKAPEYPTTATTVTFNEGVGTASGIYLYDAVASVTLTAKEGTTTKGSASFAVAAAAANSLSLPTPTEREAGTAFNETVTAWDPWHNTAKTYTGAKTLTWSGPSNSPSGQAPGYPATVTFASGVGTASIKLYDAQSTTIKAKEGTTVEGASGSFTVKATTPERFAWAHPEVTAGSIEAGTCPFACKTTSIGNSKKFKAHASITDKYGNIVSNLGSTSRAKVEKSGGEGTFTNATGLTIPTSGLAESATLFEYTSPAAGTSEAFLKLKVEEGTAYTEAEAHVKY